MSRLEVHHVFPKARLYKHGYKRAEVNALANFCFLTKETNLDISDRDPQVYFEAVESQHPGALASQWIPMDRSLWKIENYREFLAARRELLAAETNRRMEDLLHGDTQWLEGAVRSMETVVIPGGITSEDEEGKLSELNTWIEAQGLPPGQISFEFNDPVTGEQRAVFDLAWPNGLQEELSEPVAVLLNEEPETLSLASGAGFRCFTAVNAFKTYVATEVIGEVSA